ncbi:uncharacterized protein LOC128883547 isoform X2 [Hylaeus volcanicus]|uniref:uncharacterized protein LOC128883547 isoform X2 n=1 Tax=Hylaeus volcanicus TaxID=313075 RepID=UPI0023B7B79C|nr:uncharacterized protein LOC128883547 isoform X2 [Hylaeus volcanicus]
MYSKGVTFFFIFNPFTFKETNLKRILSSLHERKFKDKTIYAEEGIPETLTSVSKLSTKRTQSTGLVATTLHKLNEIKSISVQFTPFILFSPQRSVDFIARFLPPHMTIVKVYASCNVKGLYFYELPTVRDAASLGLSWKNLEIPIKCLLNYLLPSEVNRSDFEKATTLYLKINCLSASIEKYASTKIEKPSTKNPVPILIQNIHSSVTEQQLFHILKEYDLLRRLRLYQSKNPENNGFPSTKSAVVTYKTLEGSKKAIENLDKKMLCGHPFHVSWSVPKKAIQELSNEVPSIPFPDFTSTNLFY